MYLTNLIPLILFGFVSSFTPGPNNFMLMNSGINFGVKASMPHCLGVVFGFSFMLLLGILGFAAILLRYSWLAFTLKLLGAAYMLYLAYKILGMNKGKQYKQKAKPMTFMQAVLFQWLNPKAWMMVVSSAAILAGHPGNYVIEAFILGAVILVICFFSAGTWLLFGAAVQRFLNDERHKQYFNIAMSIMLVITVVMIFLD